MQNFKKTRPSPIKDDSVLLRERGDEFLNSFTGGASPISKVNDFITEQPESGLKSTPNSALKLSKKTPLGSQILSSNQNKEVTIIS